MRSRKALHRFVRRVAWPATFLALAAYFGHHALYDDHGMRRLMQLSREESAQEALLAQEKAKSAQLQAQVDALDGKSIDADLLDEQARKTLGLAKPDEIIIFKPQ